MPKYKIIIFLAVWKRPEITEICFMGLSRLKKKFGVDAFAVISESSMIPLCKKYGVDWCMHENHPLGAKKNFGLTQVMKKNFDFLIEIGSDDLLKNEIMELYPFDRDVLGLRDFVILNSEDGECRRLTDRDAKFGVGRAISRDAISKFGDVNGNYKIWGDRYTSGLDNNSSLALASKGCMEKRFASIEPLAVDIKGPENIWPFNKNRGIHYDFEKAMEGLSDQEVEGIKSLIHVAV